MSGIAGTYVKFARDTSKTAFQPFAELGTCTKVTVIPA
jgi:hypothetical protein